MDLDDELCLCFHVTKRKIVNYIRVERPQRPAQLSDCFGAGTGCGWCRKYLCRLFNADNRGGQLPAETPTVDQYAALRADYVRQGKGTPPPGATPIVEI